MKKTARVLAAVLALVSAAILSGCASATSEGYIKEAPLNNTALANPMKYEVLGTVTIDYTRTSIFIFAEKVDKVLYASLMAEAQKKYPKADAIINIYEEPVENIGFPLIFRRKLYRVTANAINITEWTGWAPAGSVNGVNTTIIGDSKNNKSGFSRLNPFSWFGK